VGTQTGKEDEYEVIGQWSRREPSLLDDANPSELEDI
jgi:hypothetical protein